MNMTQFHNRDVGYFGKIPNQMPPLLLSQIPQMHYAGEDASPVTPVLPLKWFAGDKILCTCSAKIDNAGKQGCMYVLKKSILKNLVLGVIHMETCYKCDCLVSSS